MIDIYGIIFIIIFGTLSHFAYEWSNHNKIISFLCPINESVWEHIKMTCVPCIIWSIIEIPFIGTNQNFIFAKLMPLLSIILIIPIGYYLRKLFTTKDSLLYDIFLFIISVVLAQLLSKEILLLNMDLGIVNIISLIIILFIIICILTLSYHPLKNDLFNDPLVNNYGFKAHKEYDKIKNTKK